MGMTTFHKDVRRKSKQMLNSLHISYQCDKTLVSTMQRSLLLAFLVLCNVSKSTGWWFFSKDTSGKCKKTFGAKPYYFGTSDLSCIGKKGKREASPWRSTIELNHRWIEYDGWYFEIIEDGHFEFGSPFKASQCSHARESSPAGYSHLSVECIKRCTQSYTQHFGKYNLLSNNCHHFANRISDILCSRTTCPSWC